MAHAIDTLRITRKLESAGVDRHQAEAHAETLNEVVVTRLSEVATRSDLDRLPSREELHRFATKEDLERFATKEDLERLPSREELHRFATKEDLERFATKEYLAQYPTKVEIACLEKRMFRLWAASTVTLATLIISMPFVAG